MKKPAKGNLTLTILAEKKMSLSNLEDLKYFDIVIWNENWKGENRGVKFFQITD